MEKFLRGRLDLVNVLAADVPDACYADLVLIITAVLSACASVRWPGTGNDKKRFVELLISHTPEDFHASWVSVPALINQGLLYEEETPYGRPNDFLIEPPDDSFLVEPPADFLLNGPPNGSLQMSCDRVFNTRIFCDEEIDLPFDNAKTHYPKVSSKDLRRHSYASLIYEWLRCGYAHEYRPHENIGRAQATQRKARVSYIGSSTLINQEQKRMVFFHFDYLMELARHHVSTLPETPSPEPSKWWLEQG